MPSTVLVFPITDPEAGKAFMRELHDNKADMMHALRSAQGYRRMKIWLVSQPQESAVIYIEADDVDAARQARADHDHHFEDWFEERVRAATGLDLKATLAQPPAELLLDWHPKKGVSREHHD